MKQFYKLLTAACIILIFSLVSKAEDDGMTSNIHEKYVGKIVFANKMIERDSPDEASFKNEFSSSETIYGRVFADKGVDKHPVGGSSYSSNDEKFILVYYAYVDGKPFTTNIYDKEMPKNVQGAFYSLWVADTKAWQWTTWRLYLLPAKGDEDLLDGNYPEFQATTNAFTQLLSSLPAGKHSIKIEIKASIIGKEDKTSDLIASGEFSMDVNAGDAQKQAERNVLPENKYTGADLPELKKQALAALKTQFSDSPLEIGFASDEFTESRYTDTWTWYRMITIWAAWKDSDGDGMGHVTCYNLVSDKKSDNSWSKLAFHSFTTKPYDYDYPVNAVKKSK